MFRMVVALSLVALPLAGASAQSQPDSDTNVRTLAEAEASAKPDRTLADSNTPPNKVRSVMLVGDQKCPPSTGNEIVVCSHIDQGDLYRIPKQFRRGPPSAANNSWVNRAAVADQVGREAAGLPDTCSVVGSGGQTGCTLQMLRAYSADRREQKREQESIP